MFFPCLMVLESMLRKLTVCLILILCIVSLSSAAKISDPGNPHNMSSGSDIGLDAQGRELHRAMPLIDGGTEQICIFCHTPHSAAPKTPLWSRPDPDGFGSFPVYAQSLGIKNSAVLSGYDASNPNYPSGASRMCLSCHDGATSIGVLLNNQIIVMESGDTITNDDPTINAVIDLSTSHPISFNYNPAVIAAIDPVGTEYQLPVQDYTPLDGAGQMQCTTCHDPHEDTRSALGLPFWRHHGPTVIDNRYDDVCNSCHTAARNSPNLPHSLP